MKGRLTPLAVALGFVCLQVARLAFAFERLPTTMATHFDLAGKPDGFQTRAGFAWSSILISLALFALFAALPTLLARLPERLINLPNKDYWLAPERTCSFCSGWSATCADCAGRTAHSERGARRTTLRA